MWSHPSVTAGPTSTDTEDQRHDTILYKELKHLGISGIHSGPVTSPLWIPRDDYIHTPPGWKESQREGKQTL